MYLVYEDTAQQIYNIRRVKPLSYAKVSVLGFFRASEPIIYMYYKKLVHTILMVGTIYQVSWQAGDPAELMG